MREDSNTDMMQQYVDTINDRFLQSRSHYDRDTKKYSVGTYYIHQGMGRRGVDYEIRQIETEEGGFRAASPQGITSEQCLFWLDGFVRSHYETCDLLGYELQDTSEQGDTGSVSDAETITTVDELLFGENGPPNMDGFVDSVEPDVAEEGAASEDEAPADDEGKIEG